MNIKEGISLTSGIVGILTIFVVGVSIGMYSVNTAKEVIEDKVKDNLVSIRESKKFEMENYFNMIDGQMRTLSKDLMIVDAMRRFKGAFNDFNKKMPGQKERLYAYYVGPYQNEYKNRSSGANPDVNALFEGLDDRTLSLQYHYIADNRYALGSKYRLNKTEASTAYSEVHGLFHPRMREFAMTFGYYDLFLVDLEQGAIVYSVHKEIDFATSLMDGPYADTNIGSVFRLARQAQDFDFVGLSDLAPYLPSYGDLAGFIASPIVDQNEKIGILIFQMPVDQINSIMTSGRRWKETGLGHTGETYLVGANHKMRSQSRFFIEHKARFLYSISKSGESQAIINTIRAKNSTVGLHSVNSTTVDAALSGESGIDVIQNFRNVPVLSAYAPVNIAGLKWVILSEIHEREAFATIDRFNERIFTFVLGVLMLIILASIWLCWFISRESRNQQG